jgi:hypothetical protein
MRKYTLAGGLVMMLAACSSETPKSEGSSATSASAPSSGEPKTSARPPLAGSPAAITPTVSAAASSAPAPKIQPEPAPPLAHLAGEVPKLEEELAKDEKYSAALADPTIRPVLFTAVSQIMAVGGFTKGALPILKEKGVTTPAAKLFTILSRAGRFPAPFTEALKSYLATNEKAAHLGTWSDTDEVLNLAALAVWAKPEDPRYLREHLAVMSSRGAWNPDAPYTDQLRPWLSVEAVALDRLSRMVELTPDETKRVAELTEKAKLPREVAIKKPFQLGGFTYVVTDVVAAPAVGPAIAPTKPNPSAVFVVVKFEIMNNSKAPVRVVADDFKLIDTQARVFTPSQSGSIALAMSGSGKELFQVELQPGLAHQMSTVFEVPKTLLDGKFAVLIPEKGGSRAATVTIEKKP